MLSLGGERLTPPPPPPQKKKKKKKKKPKVLDHYLHHDLVMLPPLWCFFAHLLILEYSYHHQNLISSLLYYPGPLHKISLQSVQNFFSNVAHRQTDRQTHATKNITSFAKEVIITSLAKEVMFLVVSVCLFVCLSVDNITKKVMNGLGWNFMEGSWVVQWRTD